MDTQTLTGTETESNVGIKPGANLRKTRQELGLTEDEVAIQLHLSRSIIDAIEADAFEKLHGPTFVRGYLRAYAKLLNLSPEEVITSFNVLYPDTRERAPAPDRNYQRMVIKQKHRTESSVKWVGYAIFVVMIILVLIWWHNHSTLQDSTAPKATTSAFQTPNPNNDTTAATQANSTTPVPAIPGSVSAIPVIGPGLNSQSQMTMTNPVAATVANTVANVPGMQTGTNLSPAMSEQADQKTIDVTQTTANAAAVPGLAPAPPVVTSTNTAPSTTTIKKKSSSWHNPDAN
jgi:cytoskeletal protein RodZ